MLDLNPLGPGIQNIVDFRKVTQCMCCTLEQPLVIKHANISVVKHAMVGLIGINEEHTLPCCTSGFAVKLTTKPFSISKVFDFEIVEKG